MIALLVVLISVVCALASAYFASAKGRSVPAFFFCGLLLSVVGLAIAVCAHHEEEIYRRPQRNW